jgi:hypothetical protein
MITERRNSFVVLRPFLKHSILLKHVTCDDRGKQHPGAPKFITRVTKCHKKTKTMMCACLQSSGVCPEATAHGFTAV